MWGWQSPVAWAVFLVGCGIAAVLLGLAVRFMGTMPLVDSMVMKNKKR